MSMSAVASPLSTALLLWTLASSLPAPPAGTESETKFCGTIQEHNSWAASTGLWIGDPYLASLSLTQRDPDESLPNGATR